MVAALFEGDLRYGLTVFGKPTSLDGLLTPINYGLPDTLRRCVDVDFTFYEGVELFRAFRFEDDANQLTLFSIQTHAYSISSGRAGPFIGAGIFARAAVNPVALVKSLRELLQGAQAVLMRDGRFIVQEIGANEKRLVNIPDSVEAVPDRTGHWFDKPIKTSHTKHMLILPSAAGIKSPEEFFSNVIYDPYAYSRNAFFCADPRVANDCRQRSEEFDVLTVDKVLERHRLAFDGLIQKINSSQKTLTLKDQQHMQLLAKREQEYNLSTNQIRNDARQLQDEKNRLTVENKKMRNDLDRQLQRVNSSKPTETDFVYLAISLFVALLLALVLGIGGYMLYKYLTVSAQKAAVTSNNLHKRLSSLPCHCTHITTI
jgi:hypothetical protein